MYYEMINDIMNDLMIDFYNTSFAEL